MSAMNGSAVLARTKEAIYVRLPDEVATVIDGCSCDYCKKSGLPPKWDTLVVPLEYDPKNHPRGDWCHTVHMPDPETLREAMRKKGLLVA